MEYDSEHGSLEDDEIEGYSVPMYTSKSIPREVLQKKIFNAICECDTTFGDIKNTQKTKAKKKKKKKKNKNQRRQKPKWKTSLLEALLLLKIIIIVK